MARKARKRKQQKTAGRGGGHAASRDVDGHERAPAPPSGDRGETRIANRRPAAGDTAHADAASTRIAHTRPTARDSADARPRRTRARETSPRDEKAPESPTDLDAAQRVGVLKRTVREFREDNLIDWAAALTYYGILSIFPAILAIVSVIGLLGESTTQTLVDNLRAVTPGPARDIFTDAIENLQRNQGAAGVLVVVGFAVALWSASSYVAAFMRASNDIYDVEEGRPIWKTLPTRVLTTIVLLAMFAAVTVAVTFTGPLAEQVGNLIGAGSTAVDVWDVAKWPVMLAVVMTMFAILYWAAPNVKHPRFRWVSPGSVLGVLLWLLASAAFAIYVASFASYNKTYGTLGGVIAFLVWLWVSNIAILLGAELNAEIERGRQIEAGQPPDDEPFLPPRDTRKMKHA